MIWDVSLFNDEFDLLKLRIAELSPVVDKVILIESDVTHRGKRKPHHFKESQASVTWPSKVVCFSFHDEEFQESPKANETFELRMRARLDQEIAPLFHPHDTVIFGDADEIPIPERVASCDNGMGTHRFCMHFSYYFLNLRRPDNSFRTIIGPAVMFQNLGFNYMRWEFAAGNNVFNPGGWHFSFLGGYDALVRKISQAAEGRASDWVKTESREVIEARINSGQLYSGPLEGIVTQYQFVPIDESFPKSVRDNQAEWIAKGLIKQL